MYQKKKIGRSRGTKSCHNQTTKKRGKIFIKSNLVNMPLILILVVVTSYGGIKSQKVKITSLRKGFGQSTEPNCSQDNISYLLAFRLTNTAADRIWINLQSNTPSKNFVPIASTAGHAYGMYEPGGTCYTHTDPGVKNSKPLYILYITKESPGNAGSKVCKVSRIITNNALTQSCLINTDTSFVSVVQFTGGAGNIGSFEAITVEKNKQSGYFRIARYTLDGAGVNDLNEDLIQLVANEAFSKVPDSSPAMLFSYDSLNKINSDANRAVNGFLTHKIIPEEYIPRLFYDDLPGYLLGPSGNAAIGNKHYFQKIMSEAIQKASPSIHFMIYIQNPSVMTTQDTHTINFEVRSFLEAPSQTDATLLTHVYTLSITRQSSNQIKFKLASGGRQIFDHDYQQSSPNSFIYFSLTNGAAIHYFTDQENIKVKIYETMAIFEVDATRVIFDNAYEIHNPAPLSSLFSTKTSESNSWWVKVDSTFEGGYVAQRDPKFRVLKAASGEGAYPSHKITTIQSSSKFNRCFFFGYGWHTCLSLALLKNNNEIKTLEASYFGDHVAVLDPASVLATSCRVPFNDDRCLIPLNGFITNLVSGLRGTYNGDYLTIESYQNNLKHKDFYVEYESNTGRKYLIQCPYSCKT